MPPLSLSLWNGRRSRSTSLFDLLVGNQDCLHYIIDFLDLYSIVQLSSFSSETRRLNLQQFVHEVSSDTLGARGRIEFLRLCGEGRFSGLRRLYLDGGIEDESYRALFNILRFGSCPSLQVIDLSKGNLTDCRLMALCEALSQGGPMAALRSLRELKVDNNPITDGGIAALTTRLLPTCPSLHALHISRLRLTGAGLASFANNLPRPSSSSKTSSSTEEKASQLTSLKISAVIATPHQPDPFFSAMRAGALRLLITLDISTMLIRNSGVCDLASALHEGACPLLLDLNLERVRMGQEGLERLAEALGVGKACPRLKYLNLARNALSHQAGPHALAYAMKQAGFAALESLIMHDADVSPSSFRYLCQSLREGGCPRLTELDISSNRLGELSMFHLLSALEVKRLSTQEAMNLPGSSSTNERSITPPYRNLQVLKLQRCAIDTMGVITFGSGLESGKLRALRVLSIGEGTRYSQGLLPLANALADGQCPALEDLSFSSLREVEKRQTLKASIILSQAIGKHLSRILRHLRISRITFGSENASTSLAKALSTCFRLESLCLHGTELGPVGMEALSTVLGEGGCPLLTRLSLSHNRMGHQGLIYLASAMTFPSSFLWGPRHLKELNLASNNLGSSGMKSLAAAIRSGSCTMLMKLNLDNNPLIGNEGVGVLMQAFVPAPAPPYSIKQQQQQQQQRRFQLQASHQANNGHLPADKRHRHDQSKGGARGVLAASGAGVLGQQEGQGGRQQLHDEGGRMASWGKDIYNSIMKTFWPPLRRR